MKELLFLLESGVCPPPARPGLYPKSSVHGFWLGHRGRYFKAAPSGSQHQDHPPALRFLSLARGSQIDYNNNIEASTHVLTFSYKSPLPLPFLLALGPTVCPVLEALCESCGPVKTSELKTWPHQLCSELGLWLQPCLTFLPSSTWDLFLCSMDSSLLVCILSCDSGMHLPQ